MPEATAVKRVEEPAKTTPFVSLLDQMEDTFSALTRRAYDIFEGTGRAFGRDLDNWLQAERELLHTVPVNLTESDAAFEVKAEVPGFTEKDIEIGVEPRRLIITGKRETKKEDKKGKTVYAESSSDQIFRRLDLPAEVDADKVAATLKNGILHLTLPKAAKAHTVRVHPKAG
jgi:HSP20 family protein